MQEKYRNALTKSGAYRWRIVAGVGIAIGVFFAVNWLHQVTRKPAELVGPLDSFFRKDPKTTWAVHGATFQNYATGIITPDLLAALAQAESRGNSIARGEWVWRWSLNPFRIYAPPSTAVGLFQITDGNFAQARHYCIRGGQVISEGPWFNLNSCWFNSLYNRILPTHATELTSAYLHITVVKCLTRNRGIASKVTLEQKQTLAAVIHLCGEKHGEEFVRRGFRLANNERCGASDPHQYAKRVRDFQTIFIRLIKKT